MFSQINSNLGTLVYGRRNMKPLVLLLLHIDCNTMQYSAKLEVLAGLFKVNDILKALICVALVLNTRKTEH